ncbi:hypothetical protein LCGC14_1787540 [marine sediment metagenome]|uniref:Uncharacterized protein n=1 Tax=marine sediment metagenome TaxID=412755 RepID=A0A0F9J8F1_9ZZZZ
MIEPRIHAQAGRPQSIRARALGFLGTLATGPYSPNTFDFRKFGVDLSQYNTVNLQQLADYPIPCEYALIRIGGSASVRDSKFKHYWDAAKAAGMPRSIYTYNWPGWSIDAHIANFMASIALWTPSDLGEGPIWADIETHPQGKTRKQISDHAHAYIQALERETGKVVGWYTGAWFVNGHMQPQDWMTEYWAWLATYATGKEHPGPPVIPDPIPAPKVVIQQTGSQCNSALFGGSGTFDTDRWTGSNELFAELFNEVVRPPNGDLKKQVDDNTVKNIEQDKRIKALEEWGKGIAFHG